MVDKEFMSVLFQGISVPVDLTGHIWKRKEELPQS